QSEVKSAVSKRIRYRRRVGLAKVSRRASAGEAGNRASLLPSKLNPEGFFDLATLTVNLFGDQPSIAFEHEHEERSNRSIRLAQHRIVERAFAIAGLGVVPVIDLEIALHLQMTAVGRSPLAKQMRTVAIEHEPV